MSALATATSPTMPQTGPLWALLSDNYARTDEESSRGLRSRALKADSDTDAKRTGYLYPILVQHMTEGATAPETISAKVEERIENLLRATQVGFSLEEFEEQCADALNTILYEHGNVAVTSIGSRILGGRVRSDLASELLDLVGRLEHPATRRRRLWLLERALQSASVRVRHGAALGLAYLRDRHSIPYLRVAIDSEQNGELRRTLQQVLAYAEDRR